MDLEREVSLKRETRWHEKFHKDTNGYKIKYQVRFHDFSFKIVGESGHEELQVSGCATVEKILLKHFPFPFRRLPIAWQEKMLWSFDSGREWLLYGTSPTSYRESLINAALAKNLLLDRDELDALFKPAEQQFDAICRQTSYELMGIRSLSRAA